MKLASDYLERSWKLYKDKGNKVPVSWTGIITGAMFLYQIDHGLAVTMKKQKEKSKDEKLLLVELNKESLKGFNLYSIQCFSFVSTCPSYK